MLKITKITPITSVKIRAIRKIRASPPWCDSDIFSESQMKKMTRNSTDVDLAIDKFKSNNQKNHSSDTYCTSRQGSGSIDN